MSAYVVFLIDITDHAAFSDYARAAGPTMAAHQGRIAWRGPVVGVLEGQLNVRDDTRLVVAEFPTVDEARSWWDSPDYRAVVGLRTAPVATSRVLLVDGVDLSGGQK